MDWMQVKSCILYRRNSHLKPRQTNPDSPPELITQYQVVVNVLKHYSLSLHARPAIANVNYFFGNVQKMPEVQGVQSAKGTEEQGFESTPPHHRNPAKVPSSRFSIVDSWMNVKKVFLLLKRRT